VPLPAVLSRLFRASIREGHEPGRKVTWLELFFDLVFVAAVSQVGAPLGADFTLAGLGRFAFLFVLIFWAWLGHTSYATRFDHDDVAHRALTFVQMFMAAVMAVNAKDALGSRDSAGFAAAYGVMRLVLVLQYMRVRHVEGARRLTAVLTRGFGLAAVFWLASAVVPLPYRFWIWGVAFAVDLSTPLVAGRHTLHAPPHAHHLPERFGLFTIILLGDAMVGVMRGMESQQSWPLDAFLSAVLGMLVVFLLWWIYFDVARGADERYVRTNADVMRLHAWSYGHVPLFVGIAVGGVGIHHTIGVAAAGHLHAVEAWILCGAVALATAAIAWIAPQRRGRVLALSAATLGLGVVGPFVPCSALLGAVALGLLAQVRVARA
jgi:low temperature requirement protein LtrA